MIRVNEYKGAVTPLESSIVSFFHSSYPITLFGWHSTHLSPHGPPSEAQINSTCHQDSQISLYGCFNEYKGEVTPLELPILSFYHSSYPLTLYGWHITHLSSQGPQSEAQINSTCPWDSQISLCGCLDEYKREVTPLKSPIMSFFLFLPHPPL